MIRATTYSTHWAATAHLSTQGWALTSAGAGELRDGCKSLSVSMPEISSTFGIFWRNFSRLAGLEFHL